MTEERMLKWLTDFIVAEFLNIRTQKNHKRTKRTVNFQFHLPHPSTSSTSSTCIKIKPPNQGLATGSLRSKGEGLWLIMGTNPVSAMFRCWTYIDWQISVLRRRRFDEFAIFGGRYHVIQGVGWFGGFLGGRTCQFSHPQQQTLTSSDLHKAVKLVYLRPSYIALPWTSPLIARAAMTAVDAVATYVFSHKNSQEKACWQQEVR